MPDIDLPQSDELEISVFGGGYGESICVHFGEGQWIVADSCIQKNSLKPAALQYFEDVGVDASDSVKLVLATHWHDDHIKGISEIVKLCVNADVAVTGAFDSREAAAFVFEKDSADSELSSGVSEFRKILELCSGTGRLKWAKATVQLYPRGVSTREKVVALSPSEETRQRTLEWLIEGALDATINLNRRSVVSLKPNAASVVSYFDALGVQAVLGADLEVSTDALGGWDAVLSHAVPESKSSALKVPHHGSETGHHEGIWSELMLENPLALLTPWAKGGGSLPRNSDVDRILGYSNNVYLTAPPRFVRARVSREVQRLLSRLGRGDINEFGAWGHVRARRRSDESEWHVDLFGDAARIEGEVAV